MSLFIPGTNPIRRLKLFIRNFPSTIENIKVRRENRKKNLQYEDIVLIEYRCYEMPECFLEKACIDKKLTHIDSYKNIVEVLRKNHVLKWKRHYFANFDYYDGTDWEFKLTFKNGETIISSGDIIFPKNFKKIYKALKDYIALSEVEFDDYYETISLDEWYKKEIL